MMNYSETKEYSDVYRKEYLDSIEKLLDERAFCARQGQEDRIRDILKHPDRARKELKEMLGWPLTEKSREIPRVTKTLLSDEGSCCIYRLRFDLSVGLKFYGLFFEQKCDRPLALVITQNGFLGTPELASGFFGATNNYNDMVQRVLAEGVHVFAPQLMLWDFDGDVAYDRVMIDARLKQLGSSVAAVEIFEILQSVDYLATLDCVDENRIGMVGLSYGGFYTLFTTAVDTRIKAALSCCFYNDRYQTFFPDWTWFRSGYRFTDNEIAALIYPRHLFLEVGENDPTFPVSSAKSEYEKLVREIADQSWLHFRAFDGKHEFYSGNEDIDALITLLNNL